MSGDGATSRWAAVSAGRWAARRAWLMWQMIEASIAAALAFPGSRLPPLHGPAPSGAAAAPATWAAGASTAAAATAHTNSPLKDLFPPRTLQKYLHERRPDVSPGCEQQ